MSIQGIVLIDLVGLGLMVLVLQLVRKQTLNVGYAVVWLAAILALMGIISIPPLQTAVTVAVGATYPASALSLLAFVFVFVMLISFSVHLTQLSSRQVKLIQAIALHELDKTHASSAAETRAAPEATANSQASQ